MVMKLEKCALELLQNNGQEMSAEKENMAMKLATIVKTLKTKLDYLAKLDEEIMEKCQIEEIENEVDEATEISAQIVETIDRIDMFGRKVVEKKEWSIHPQAPLRGVQFRWMSCSQLHSRRMC